MSKSLLEIIIERSPGPWVCACCEDEVLRPRHADEGDGEDMRRGSRDRIYCNKCGSCGPGMPAHEFCDSCYSELSQKLDQLGDAGLIEAARIVLGFGD